MSEPVVRRRPWFVRLLHVVFAALCVAAMGAAAVSWVSLSRPFDPPQVAPVAAPASVVPVALPPGIPAYPGSVTVLTYHAVSDTDRSASTVTRLRFAEHLSMLAAAGYRTVRLADVERLISGHPVALPERALLLTFDDGAVTDWTTVDPVLRAHDFTAVAFLTTGRLVEPGRPSFYLSTRQVQAMRESGRWDFGGHTHNLHARLSAAGGVVPALTNLVTRDGRPESVDEWRERVRADLTENQRAFIAMFGTPVTAFAYPYGQSGGAGNAPELSRELPALLEEAGFRSAFAGEHVPTGHVDALTGAAPRWSLPRIGVRGTTTVEDLRAMVTRAIPVAPPPDLTSLRWHGDAAECVTTPGQSVRLKVVAGGFGSCTLGEINTSPWRDYTVATRVTGVNRRATAIVAVRDGAGAGHRGRVEVVLGESRLVIRQQIGDGPSAVLASAPIRPGTRDHLSIEVRGDRVTARLPGNRPVAAAIDQRLPVGGVRFAAASKTGKSITFSVPTLTAVVPPPV